MIGGELFKNCDRRRVDEAHSDAEHGGTSLIGLWPGAASAQTMPLNEFIATADRIPRNVTALLTIRLSSIEA